MNRKIPHLAKFALAWVLFFSWHTCWLSAQSTVRTFGDQDFDSYGAVSATPDGGYVTVGTHFNPIRTGRDVLLTKFSPEGTPQWTRTYGAEGIDEEGVSVLTGPTGNYFITGRYLSGDAFVTYLASVNADGTLAWERRYLTQDGRGFNPAGAALALDGGFYVVGSNRIQDDTNQLVALKMSAAGDIVWSNISSAVERTIDTPYGIISTPDNGFVIVGNSIVNASSVNGLIAKYTDNGTQVWGRRYRTDAGTVTFTSVTLNRTGGYTVSGNLTTAPYGWTFTNEGLLSDAYQFDLAGEIIPVAVNISGEQTEFFYYSPVEGSPTDLNLTRLSSDLRSNTAVVSRFESVRFRRADFTNPFFSPQSIAQTSSGLVFSGLASNGICNSADGMVLTLPPDGSLPCNTVTGEINYRAADGFNPSDFNPQWQRTNLETQTNPSITEDAPLTERLVCDTCAATGQPRVKLHVSATDSRCFNTSDGSIRLSHLACVDGLIGINGAPLERWVANVGSLPPGEHVLTYSYGAGTRTCQDSLRFTIAAPAPVTFELTLRTPSPGGSDGQITVTNVTGGVPPYQYSINGVDFSNAPTFFNLAAGTYTVTVRDRNGCLFIQVRTLTEGGSCSFDAQVISNNISCPGGIDRNFGIIFIQPITGRPPYTYRINGTIFENPFIDSLAAGEYLVQVTDSAGCRSNDTIITIREENTPIVLDTVSFVAPACRQNNGTISVRALGGRPPYTYSLGPGFTNNTGEFSGLPSSIYNVNVTDAAGCSAVITSVSLLSQGTHTATAEVQNVLCFEDNTGRITINATGGNAPYSYQLSDTSNVQVSNVFNNLRAGNYNIIIYDRFNCAITVSVTVEQPAEPIGAFYTSEAPLCPDQTGSLNHILTTGGTAPYRYSLSAGGPFRDDPNFTGVRAQRFVTIYVRDANGCIGILEQEFNGNNLLTIDSLNITPATCGRSDGTVVAFASGAAQYLFSIDGLSYGPNPVFTNRPAGRDTLFVRDGNGCIATREFTIANAGAFELILDASLEPCANRNNGVIQVRAGAGAVGTVTYAIAGVGSNNTGSFTNLAARVYTVTATDQSGCISERQVTLNTSAPIRFNVTPQAPVPANASNGRITVTVTGGTGPFVFFLRGAVNTSGNGAGPFVFNNLPCGDYQISVSNVNGCSSDTSTVNFPCGANFSVNALGVPPRCFGESTGRMIVTVLNGTAPFRYRVNGGTEQTAAASPINIENLPCGTASLSVRDNAGNSQNVNVVIACPERINPALTVTNPTCATSSDGRIVVTIPGGTDTYTYSLNDTLNFTSANVYTGLRVGTYRVCVRNSNGCQVCTTTVLSAAAGIRITDIQVVQPNCDTTDGVITVTAEGGNLEYSVRPGVFQASNTFRDLAPGLQVVQVRQIGTGCTASDSVLLFGRTDLDIVAEVTAPSCNAGNDATVILIPSGGLEPYEYSTNGLNYNPNNTFTGLALGNYVFYVKDGSGCADTVNVFIGGANAPVMTAETVEPACGSSADGSITLLASGGTAPYTFSSDSLFFGTQNTFSSLPAGSYRFFVRDNSGCGSSLTVTLTAQGGVKIDTLLITPATCSNANGIVTVEASGGSGMYRYFLGVTSQDRDSVFTSIRPGVYRISVLDVNTGCFDSRDFEVGSVADLDITFQAIAPSCTNLECGSFNVIAQGGVSPYTYSTDGLTYGTSATYPCVTPDRSYLIYVKDALGCTDTARVFVPGYVPITFSSVVTALPGCGNPTGGTIEVTAVGGAGQYFYELSGNPTSFTGTITGVRAGTYTLHVRDFNGCTSDTAEITVRGLDSVRVDTIVTVVPNCDQANGFITVTVEPGSGENIEFSLNGTDWQEANSFGGLVAGIYSVQMRNSDGCITFQNVTLVAVGDYTTDLLLSNPTCNGSRDGSVTVREVTGGTAPYRYSLDGIIFSPDSVIRNLGVGSYQLHVRDADGCPFIQTFELTQPEAIEVLVSKVLPICWGRPTGELAILAQGGTPPYRYSLNGGSFVASNLFTGLVAGPFILITEDANGCQFVTRDTLGVEGNKVPITVTDVIISQTRCEGVNNGRARVIISGGTPPFRYRLNGSGDFQLNPTFLNLGVGSYTVEVLDADSCGTKDTARFNVTPRFSNLIKDVIVERPNCNGNLRASVRIIADPVFDKATYSLNGGATFQASNTFTGVEIGNYIAVLQYGNGCIESREVSVRPNENITIENIEAVVPKCIDSRDGSIRVIATSSDVNLTYSIDGSNFQPANTFTGLNAGNYTVTVRSNSGCLATRQISLVAPDALTLSSPSIVQPTCSDRNNGTIIVFAAGGTAPVRYALDGNVPSAQGVFENLRPGKYVITAIDANGCRAFTEVTLRAPAGPSIAVTVTASSTFGSADGRITVNVTDGVAPYRYSADAGISFGESNVFTGLAEGFYTVVVEDANGCRSEKIVRIAIANADACPAPMEVSVTNVTLTGAEVRWQPVNGAVRYEVRWRVRDDNNRTPWEAVSVNATFATLSGLRSNFIYEVQVRTVCVTNLVSPYSDRIFFNTSGGCDIPIITELEGKTNSAVITWVAQGGVIRYVVSYRIAGSGSWREIQVPGVNNSIELPGLRPQTRYAVRIKAICNAVESPWSFTYSVRTEAREGLFTAGETSDEFSVYPNPTHGTVELGFTSASEGTAEISLFDLAGRLLHSTRQPVSEGKNTLSADFTGISTGVYLLKVTEGTTVKTVRLVIE